MAVHAPSLTGEGLQPTKQTGRFSTLHFAAQLYAFGRPSTDASLKQRLVMFHSRRRCHTFPQPEVLLRLDCCAFYEALNELPKRW